MYLTPMKEGVDLCR